MSRRTAGVKRTSCCRRAASSLGSGAVATATPEMERGAGGVGGAAAKAFGAGLPGASALGAGPNALGAGPKPKTFGDGPAGASDDGLAGASALGAEPKADVFVPKTLVCWLTASTAPMAASLLGARPKGDCEATGEAPNAGCCTEVLKATGVEMLEGACAPRTKAVCAALLAAAAPVTPAPNAPSFAACGAGLAPKEVGKAESPPKAEGRPKAPPTAEVPPKDPKPDVGKRPVLLLGCMM